jgi:RES domain-containing protein
MDICLLGWSGAREAAQPGPVPWAYTLHHSMTNVLVPSAVTRGGPDMQLGHPD